MIMFTMTAPRRKLKRALQAGGLVLLLAAVVPAIYSSLTEAEAMSSFAEGGAAADAGVIAEEQAGDADGTGTDAADAAVDAKGNADAEGGDSAAGAADGEGTEGAASAESAEDGENGLLRALREAIWGPEQKIEMY